MRPHVIWIVLTVTLFSCISQEYKEKDHYPITEVAASQDQWTGLTITRDNKIFVNYPRWSDYIPMSVGFLNEQGNPVPFPDSSWNEWSKGMSAERHFICVQSVVVDDEGRLWVLDPANPQFGGVIQGGAKLVAFEPSTGKMLQRIVFDSTVVQPNSYLNDVRVDTEKGYAYITDSNDGAIVVVNLSNGNSRRLLDEHYSTQPELPLVINGQPWLNAEGQPNLVASDGIALDRDNRFLYYHPLSGLSLYRIDTRFLRDTGISKAERKARVEFVARTVSSDGMITGRDNAIYHSDVENNAIVRYNQDGSLQTIARSEKIKWPDTFTMGPAGNLYFTTSQIHIRNSKQPYRIFKIDLPARENK